MSYANFVVSVVAITSLVLVSIVSWYYVKAEKKRYEAIELTVDCYFENQEKYNQFLDDAPDIIADKVYQKISAAEEERRHP